MEYCVGVVCEHADNQAEKYKMWWGPKYCNGRQVHVNHVVNRNLIVKTHESSLLVDNNNNITAETYTLDNNSSSSSSRNTARNNKHKVP